MTPLDIVRLWRFLAGYVLLSVECRTPEKFINLARSNGLRAWDIRITGQKLTLCLPVSDFFAVRALARMAFARVRIRGKFGLPFLWRRARRRSVFIIGPILVGAVLFAFSSFVWFVEITGAEILEQRVILEGAARLGLRPPAWKGRLNPKQLGINLPLEVNGLAWAAVEIHGTVAIIEVVEKQRPKEPQQYVAEMSREVVATRDGLVQVVIIMAGLPLVTEGQVVKAGDVLITPWSASPDKPPIASGIVRARCWNEAQADVLLEETHYHRTGKAYHRLAVRIGDREIILKGWKPPPFAVYEAAETVKGPLWRNRGPTVELVETVFWELQAEKSVRSREEALSLAREKARHEALRTISPGVKVLREYFEVIPVDDRTIRVKVVVETLEDIARPRPLKELPNGKGG